MNIKKFMTTFPVKKLIFDCFMEQIKKKTITTYHNVGYTID